MTKRTTLYHCPQGKTLTYRNTSPEQRRGQPKVLQRRYESQPADCSGCPLRQKCLQDTATKKRTISRDQYEPVRERHATRMAQPAAQEIYQQRRHAAERPFAFIKQNLGARQFLLRGLDRVKQEWRWLVSAFNLRCLLSAWPSRPGRESVAAARNRTLLTRLAVVQEFKDRRSLRLVGVPSPPARGEGGELSSTLN